MLTSIKKYHKEHAETCYENIKFIKEKNIFQSTIDRRNVKRTNSNMRKLLGTVSERVSKKYPR
jgi:hypothetical protein